MPGVSSAPLWGPSRAGGASNSRSKIIIKSSAAGGASGPGAFDDDEKGWKDTESGFVPQRTYEKKSGVFRFPSLTDLSSTLPPVSRLHKFKNFILRVSQSVVHTDRPSLLPLTINMSVRVVIAEKSYLSWPLS